MRTPHLGGMYMRMIVEPRFLEGSRRRSDLVGEGGALVCRPTAGERGPGIALGPLEGDPRETPDDDVDIALGRSLSADAEVPYLSCFTSVRDALLGILGARERPLETRLVAFMEVADRVSEYFDENSTSVDAAQLAADLRVEFGPPPRDAQSHVDLMASRVARYYLRECDVQRSTRLGRLVEKVRLAYGRPVAAQRWSLLTEGEALAACGGEGFEASVRVMAPPLPPWDEEMVLRSYRSRRALLLLSHGRRLERAFTNYCLNHLLVERYIDWPNLRAYARDLALRIATARFLSFSHPSVGAAWEVGRDGPESREVEGEAWTVQAVDHAVAETFQCISRVSEPVAYLDQLRRSTGIDDAVGPAALAALVMI